MRKAEGKTKLKKKMFKKITFVAYNTLKPQTPPIDIVNYTRKQHTKDNL